MFKVLFKFSLTTINLLVLVMLKLLEEVSPYLLKIVKLISIISKLMKLKTSILKLVKLKQDIEEPVDIEELMKKIVKPTNVVSITDINNVIIKFKWKKEIVKLTKKEDFHVPLKESTKKNVKIQDVVGIKNVSYQKVMMIISDNSMELDH